MNTKGQKYTRVDIALQPTKAAQEYAIRLSKEISQKTDTYFTLDNKNFYPHATLYATEYPDKNIEKILRITQEIASETKTFIITLESLKSHQGYIDFQLVKTEECMDLHEKIVTQLNPFRENHLRDKYTQREELVKYTQEQQKYIKKYGYAEVFTTFRPHITLSRTKDEKIADEIIKQLKFIHLQFSFTTIAAYTMGDHGTCTGIIEEFHL